MRRRTPIKFWSTSFGTIDTPQGLSQASLGFFIGDLVARINIEDSLFRDRRFLQLCIAVGDPDRALGMMVNAWLTAFDYWKQDRKNIPRLAWLERCLNNSIIECGLARIVNEDEIYVCGTREHHDWYHQRVAAGRRGGLKSQEKKSSTAQAKGSKLKQKQPSSSVSSSVSISISDSNIIGDDLKNRSPGNFFIPEYIKTWEAKYGSRPILSGKDLGIAKRISNSLAGCTESEIRQLVTTYFTADEQWFKTKAHDIATFEQNISKLRALANKPEPEWIRKAKQEEQERKLRNGNA